MKQSNEQTSMNNSFSYYKRAKRLLGHGIVCMAATLAMTSSAQAVELLKFMVSEPGMQRIKYEDLPADFDLQGLKHAFLHVLTDGKMVSVEIKGQDSEHGLNRFFGPGGYIKFYAEPANSLYTDESVYELHYMNNRDLARNGYVSTRVAIDGSDRYRRSEPVSNIYSHTKTVEDNSFYDFAAPSATDPWHFGQNFSIFATPSYEFELTDVAGGSASAEVKAQMYGLLDFDIAGNDHHYEILVNDIPVGDQQFDGNTIDTFNGGNAVVNEGVNAFKYNYRPIAEVPFDIVALNNFEVTYPRYTKGINNHLEGTFDGGHYSVSGISSGSFKIYRLENTSDGIVPSSIISGRRQSDGSIVFNAGNNSAHYIVLSEDAEGENSGYKAPRLQKLLVKNNITSDNAEYLIIANDGLMGDELDQLVALRSQRYNVKVVDVAQIYIQFGNGTPDAESISDYVKFAAENLGTRFVTLVGNDSYDYKGNGETGSFSLIPTPYVTTPGGQLIVTQTPSDASYGDLDSDGIPDLPIGRISARTKGELQAVVNKLVDYETRVDYAGRVLVAADKEDTGNGVSFIQDAEALIAAMPKSWRDSVRGDFKAYPDVDGGQLAHDKTINAINAGVSVVNFIGHSSHRRWSFSSPPILQSNEISSFTNVGKPALVTQWGCWNSYYVDPAGNTMADEFLVGGENGAATVLGASTLTSSAGERALAVELNKRMYEEGLTIGEAVIQAKKALVLKGDYPDIQMGWQIIGDPALMVDPI